MFSSDDAHEPVSAARDGPQRGSWRHRARIYVDPAHPAHGEIESGREITLASPRAHHLGRVLRVSEGYELELFDGVSGLWLGVVSRLSRAAVAVTVGAQLAPQQPAERLGLAFAPIRAQRQSLLVQKAVELGVSRLQPVITAHSSAAAIGSERLEAIAIGAAEQSQRDSVPQICAAVSFQGFMDSLDSEDLLIAPVEDAPEAIRYPDLLSSGVHGASEWILIGPEGGFSGAEREQLAARAKVTTLGPRVLRSETAAIVAVSGWMMNRGEWGRAR